MKYIKARQLGGAAVSISIQNILETKPAKRDSTGEISAKNKAH